MDSWLGIIIFSVFFICSWAYTKENVPDIYNEAFIKKYIDAHNKFRSEVNPEASNMRRMSWDPHLAKLAKSWAETCPSGHNPRRIHPSFSAVGENIWFGPVDAAVKLWYDEFRNFNFETQECAQKKMCLHYTQVVWAHTFKVGCALHYCTKIKGYPSDHGALFICNYAPAGNYFPLKPYMKGKSCAACPSGDTCEDRLCANPKRDTVLAIPSKPTSKPISNLISNPNFNHKESTVKHEENISVVLILLPIFTILSIILAIVIKCYYPR